MAQALSEAVQSEFLRLDEAWGQDDEKKKTVKKFLKHVAKCAEKACVMKALQISAASDLAVCSSNLDQQAAEEAEEEALRERHAELEFQLGAVEGQIEDWKIVKENILQIGHTSPLEGDLDSEPEFRECDDAEIEDAVPLDAGPSQQDEYLMRLFSVERWLHDALIRLQVREQALTGRAAAAAAKAWPEFDGAPQGRQALTRIP